MEPNGIAIRFERKIRKTGGSYVVVIPPEIIKSSELKDGTRVYFELYSEGLFLKYESYDSSK